MTPFALVGDRVRLSVPTEDDTARIFEACQDAELQRWTSVPVPYLPAHAAGFVAGAARAWEEETALVWAVRQGGDLMAGEAEPPPLGMVTLRLDNAPAGARSGEVGFWGAPEARGRALMTEAVRLVVHFGLGPEGAGLARVLWMAHVGNWASRRVAEKAGFTVEGEVRAHLVQRGRRVDAWIGTMLPGDPRP